MKHQIENRNAQDVTTDELENQNDGDLSDV